MLVWYYDKALNKRRLMVRKHPFLVFIGVCLIVTLACVQPGAAPAAPDPNAVNTAIVQTIAARQTEAALANPPTATLTFTPSPFPPTFTASPEPLPTETMGLPMITVSVDTNCRTGPGSLFERVGVLLVGETTQIVGREVKGEFWLVNNPDRPGETCWLWGEYGTFSGNIFALSNLPVPTPGPTSFSAKFTSLEVCASAWWVNFTIVNKTDAVFQSVSMVVTDTKKPATVNLNSNDFTKSIGCEAPVKTGSLSANETMVISAPALNFNPKGHPMIAKFKLCLDENQSGTCLTQEINFTP
jgi:hypothetical protein